MKRINTMILSGVVLALPVMAIAAPTIAFSRDAQVKSITAGQSEEDVRSEMGKPYSVRHMSGEKHLYYKVEDSFGQASWLDVALDGNGYVVRKGELQMQSGH